MTLTVAKFALKPKLLEYLRRVAQKRETIVVTDRKRPVAKIVPFDDETDVFAELKGSVRHYERPLDPVAEEDWELQ